MRYRSDSAADHHKGPHCVVGYLCSDQIRGRACSCLQVIMDTRKGLRLKESHLGPSLYAPLPCSEALWRVVSCESIEKNVLVWWSEGYIHRNRVVRHVYPPYIHKEGGSSSET
jgi:hypothetical protein